jgi:hypothetical protein
MKPWPDMWFTSSSIGSQNSLILAKTIGLAVSAELTPGHDLDDLFQRADAAGQGDEGVERFEHRDACADACLRSPSSSVS